ncbi:MAG: hypothetical protein AAFR98_06005 [Pseudomonadota bacterium]
MKKTTLVLSVTALVVAGCSVDKAEYLSEPVLVKTPKGIVTCQLYRDDRVLWDEAVAFPQSRMTLAEADEVCQEEGRRVREEGRRPADTDDTTG